MPPEFAVVGARGWFGRTLVHEYLNLYGPDAVSQLTLFGSSDGQVELRGTWQGVRLPVRSLASISVSETAEWKALFWFSFLLHRQVGRLGLDEYRRANDDIAGAVFSVLERHPDLTCIFASSGVARSRNPQPAYEAEPYTFLKLFYEARLRERGHACVVYPYASTGLYMTNTRDYALGDFIHQSLTDGGITLSSRAPMVRSYGNVGDLCRYLLRCLSDTRLPEAVVPVTHTLSLDQLASEVLSTLGLPQRLSRPLAAADAAPSVYASDDLRFATELVDRGLTPTPLAQQILETTDGITEAEAPQP